MRSGFLGLTELGKNVFRTLLVENQGRKKLVCNKLKAPIFSVEEWGCFDPLYTGSGKVVGSKQGS